MHVPVEIMIDVYSSLGMATPMSVIWKIQIKAEPDLILRLSQEVYFAVMVSFIISTQPIYREALEHVKAKDIFLKDNGATDFVMI